ncbi:tetratricopeptide repeat protein [Hyphomicrobium sp. D-2]|uniref:tetratricopeptide repeat protein n=1 Tax=Hyphomicrobium sp. D-2 TaxID=3041621 RepID=UPI002453EA32|nr:tetratricopeptide repeat protein [Hyphomicrobium sp. D-2]MDH4981981.1 tetratricopeptide repeat protein [Hyphomicrobium sp. D-2]
MREIEFHTEVGAPQKYRPLYVSIYADDDDTSAVQDANRDARRTEQLAQQGSPFAQFLLAHMYLSGQDKPQDYAAAYRWFARSAASGRADALNMVGRCYECGWGVEIDRAEAARWYRLAIEQGHAWAMFNLASLMMQGDGVTQDAEGALALFVRAARLGNIKAMNMIGQYREDGWRGRVRLRSAARWYQRAAEGGCFRGQYNLARFLARMGQTQTAAQWLRVSFAAAPPQFCREVGEMLANHPDANLRDAACEALLRAETPARHPAA